MMQVKIDGRMYDLNNTFVMDNVRPGRHVIAIYKTENVGFRKRTTEIYNNAMFISTGQFVSIDINRFGKVVSKTTDINKFDRDDRYNNRNNNYGRH